MANPLPELNPTDPVASFSTHKEKPLLRLKPNSRFSRTPTDSTFLTSSRESSPNPPSPTQSHSRQLRGNGPEPPKKRGRPLGSGKLQMKAAKQLMATSGQEKSRGGEANISDVVNSLRQLTDPSLLVKPKTKAKPSRSSTRTTHSERPTPSSSKLKPKGPLTINISKAKSGLPTSSSLPTSARSTTTPRTPVTSSSGTDPSGAGSVNDVGGAKDGTESLSTRSKASVILPEPESSSVGGGDGEEIIEKRGMGGKQRKRDDDDEGSEGSGSEEEMRISKKDKGKGRARAETDKDDEGNGSLVGKQALIDQRAWEYTDQRSMFWELDLVDEEFSDYCQDYELRHGDRPPGWVKQNKRRLKALGLSVHSSAEPSSRPSSPGFEGERDSSSAAPSSPTPSTGFVLVSGIPYWKQIDPTLVPIDPPILFPPSAHAPEGGVNYMSLQQIRCLTHDLVYDLGEVQPVTERCARCTKRDQTCIALPIYARGGGGGGCAFCARYGVECVWTEESGRAEGWRVADDESDDEDESEAPSEDGTEVDEDPAEPSRPLVKEQPVEDVLQPSTARISVQTYGGRKIKILLRKQLERSGPPEQHTGSRAKIPRKAKGKKGRDMSAAQAARLKKQKALKLRGSGLRHEIEMNEEVEVVAPEMDEDEEEDQDEEEDEENDVHEAESAKSFEPSEMSSDQSKWTTGSAVSETPSAMEGLSVPNGTLAADDNAPNGLGAEHLSGQTVAKDRPGLNGDKVDNASAAQTNSVKQTPGTLTPASSPDDNAPTTVLAVGKVRETVAAGSSKSQSIPKPLSAGFKRKRVSSSPATQPRKTASASSSKASTPQPKPHPPSRPRTPPPVRTLDRPFTAAEGSTYRSPQPQSAAVLRPITEAEKQRELEHQKWLDDWDEQPALSPQVLLREKEGSVTPTPASPKVTAKPTASSNHRAMTPVKASSFYATGPSKASRSTPPVSQSSKLSPIPGLRPIVHAPGPSRLSPGPIPGLKPYQILMQREEELEEDMDICGSEDEDMDLCGSADEA